MCLLKDQMKAFTGRPNSSFSTVYRADELMSCKLLQIVGGVLGLTLEQPDLSWTKEKGKRAYFSCKVTDLKTDYVHWYQQKDNEALKRILYVSKAGKSPVRDNNHPDRNDFDVQLERGNDYVLRIDAVKLTHSGVYFCACWESGAQ
ncbi:hypothetical protein NFI96_031426 [Prochilodus magdalenae]|nr:hypothetical protein NFI96_031426 [Prochilodus magdalenae]